MKSGAKMKSPCFISPCSAQSHSIPLDCLLNGPNIIWLTEERWSSDPSWLGIYPKLLANQRMATYCDYLISTGLISFISYWGSLCLFWQEHDGNLVYGEFKSCKTMYFAWCVIHNKNILFTFWTTKLTFLVTLFFLHL